MLECLILGDSIGVGISHYRKECISYVKSGINSDKFLKSYPIPGKFVPVIIISLGTNDTSSIDTYENLRKLRRKVHTDKVFWIVPSKTIKPTQNAAVKRLAAEFGDSSISITSNQLSGDKIHPTGSGYKALGGLTK